MAYRWPLQALDRLQAGRGQASAPPSTPSGHAKPYIWPNLMIGKKIANSLPVYCDTFLQHPPLYERFVGHSWKCQERWHVPKLAERTCKIILLLPVHLIGLLFLTKLWQCLNLRRKLLKRNSWVFWMRWTIQRGLHQMFRVFIHIFQAKKKYRTTTLRNFTKHASKEKVTWNVGFLSLSYLFSNIVIVFY